LLQKGQAAFDAAMAKIRPWSIPPLLATVVERLHNPDPLVKRCPGHPITLGNVLDLSGWINQQGFYLPYMLFI